MSVAIKFAGTKVSELSLKVNRNKDKKLKDNFDLKFTSGYCEEDDKSFIIEFTIRISSEEEEFTLDLIYTGFFETSETITEDFRVSPFPSVNAPAIVYPFMRSFVNTITVNAGLNPVILPTINFQELFRKNSKTKSAESKPKSGKKKTKKLTKNK